MVCGLMTKSEKRQNELCMWAVAGVLTSVGVLLLWWYWGHYPIRLYPKASVAPDADGYNAGTFGDSFGFVNSLFSCLGVIGATIALILQVTLMIKTNRIAEQAKLDEKRQSELAALMKLHYDMLHLFHCANKLGSAVNKTDEEVPSRRDDRTEFWVARNMLIANQLPLELLFDKNAKPLDVAIDKIAKKSMKLFDDDFPREPGLSRGTFLVEDADEIRDIIKNVWHQALDEE
jgi:hypothetical protein